VSLTGHLNIRCLPPVIKG